MSSYENPGMNDYLARLKAIVVRHGHAVQYVMPDPETGAASFAYTVGAHRRRGYELALSGLDAEVSYRLLNSLVARIDAGELTPAPGLEVDGVLAGGYDFRLVQVGSTAHFTMVRAVFGRTAPVWQAVWPDKAGRFPDDDLCSLSPGVQTML